MMIKYLTAFAGVLLSFSAAAQDYSQNNSEMQILPNYGTYLDSQFFDIAISLPKEFNGYLNFAQLPPYSPIKLQATINGNKADSWLNTCLQQHKLINSGSDILLCKAQDISPFTEGENLLKISIQEFDRTLHSASAHYFIVKSQRQYNRMPHTFTIPGSSFNTMSGVMVALGQSVFISATGTVNVWPANPSFQLSTPRGVGSCSTTSNCLLIGAPVGALLVKIGTYGRWNYVGSGYFTADRPGELIFAVNDRTISAFNEDNIGSYEITLR